MNGEIIQYKIADISPSLPFRLKITEIWECVKYKIAIFRFCEMLYLCYVCVLRYVLCLCYVCVLCFVFCLFSNDTTLLSFCQVFHGFICNLLYLINVLLN